VQIHGAVNQRELARIMRHAHIFILPSFYEGIPLVVLEALACGCRIVANDLPGTQEILGGTAVAYISLIQTPRLKTLDAPLPEEENAFEERLATALRIQMAATAKQPDLDLSALQEKLDSFSWTNVFERIQKIYIESIENFRMRNGK
jgi:glycosyltransferase involved in cell wall biosynthesis